MGHIYQNQPSRKAYVNGVIGCFGSMSEAISVGGFRLRDGDAQE